MSQKNIDFGSFPNDPSADAIRTAFQKVQENFTDLYNGQQAQAVLSVNRTPGAGISVNAPSGNVVVSAKIAQVQIQTNTLGVGTGGSNSAKYAVIFDGSTPINIDIPSTLNNVANINLSNTLTANFVIANANLTAANASITANLSAGNITSGNITITANANVNQLNAGNGAFTGNISAISFTGTNVSATGNVAAGNLTTTGALAATGNANVGNLGTAQVLATANVTAPQLISNIATGTAPFVVTSTTQVANLNAATAGLATFATTANAVAGSNVSGQVNFAATANSVAGANVTGAVTSATNAAAVQSNTSTNSTVYLLGTATSANGNVGLEKVTGITANYAANSITATSFIGTLANGTSNVNIAAANGNVSVAVAGAIRANFTSTGANVTGTGNFTGNLSAANLIGPLANGTSNVSIATGANVSVFVAGTIRANFTTTGANVSGTFNATGNANVGNLGAAQVVASANVTAPQIISSIATGTAPFIVTSTTQVANLNAATAGSATNAAAVQTNASIATTVYPTFVSSSANANYSLNTVSGISANLANNAITATTFVGSLSGAATTATTAATVTTAAQPNITSVGTLTSVDISGNISSGNANLGNLAIANYFQGDGSLLSNLPISAGSFIANGTSNVAVDNNGNLRATIGGTPNVFVVTSTGANISGTANVTGNANVGNLGANNVVATAFVGNLATAAQPNVTSLGTLTGLTVNGISNFGIVDNLRISGGSNNQVLVATGTGSNLAFITATALTTAPGVNTQVLFNDSGSFAASSLFTFNKTTGNANLGNVGATNAVFSTVAGSLTTASQPNITTVGTLTSLNMSGNVISTANIYANTGTIGALNLTGTLTTAAQPNITSVGTLTALGVNGTITAVNITANTGVFTGNGSGLTNLAAANIVGTVASATTAATATSATTAGTVTTNAQPNITSVGTLTSLTALGNINANNISVTNNANTRFLGVASGVLTSSLPAANITQTWNNSSASFGAVVVNITDTASLAGSKLLDLQVGGVPVFAVDKAGNISFSGVSTGNGAGLSALNASNITTGTLSQALLANSSLSVNGSSISLGGSAIVTANTTATLTNGSYITGSSFNGGTARTWAVDADTAATASKIVARDANANIAGNFFIGNGSQLASITGANVTGAVAFATTANSVAGANVSGAVAFASTANSVAGANVSGAVAFASTANSVAGSNVSGAVAFATTANSVTGANVTGTVSSATTAGTVTTAAQPNITSVGTLTGITIAANGNVTLSGSLSQVTGANLVSASFLSGNGSSITGINASSITSGSLSTARLSSNSVSINGTSIALGGTATITATTTRVLTLGSYLTGTSFDGSANVTAAVDATSTTTASKVVARDINGSFSANVITATLFAGNGSSITNLTSGQITGALGFTPYNSTNPSGYITSSGSITGSAGTFTSTTQNSQFNSIGVGTPGSGTAGEIRATNNITSYYSSDIKFKENVQSIENALETVETIGGKTFDWTDDYIEAHGGEDGYFIRKSDFGVIAQDVQRVFPLAVRERDDGSLAVDYEKLSALAFAAISELSQRIRDLEEKLK